MNPHWLHVIAEMEDAEAREQYMQNFLSARLALQIKTLRQQRNWSQTELAERAGKKQSQISAMEQIDFSSWTVSSLEKLASAFDVALSVKFESFSRFLEDVVKLDTASLEVPSFNDEREIFNRLKPVALGLEFELPDFSFAPEPLENLEASAAQVAEVLRSYALDLESGIPGVNERLRLRSVTIENSQIQHNQFGAANDSFALVA